MKRLLLTRTRHDVGNEYLFAYSEAIVGEATERGWQCDDVSCEKASGEAVRDLSQAERPGVQACLGEIWKIHGE